MSGLPKRPRIITVLLGTVICRNSFVRAEKPRRVSDGRSHFQNEIIIYGCVPPGAPGTCHRPPASAGKNYRKTFGTSAARDGSHVVETASQFVRNSARIHPRGKLPDSNYQTQVAVTHCSNTSCDQSTTLALEDRPKLSDPNFQTQIARSKLSDPSS